MAGFGRETVEVAFDEEGNPSIHVKGHKGTGCKELTAELEKKLGKVVSDQKTAEYNERPNVNVLKQSN